MALNLLYYNEFTSAQFNRLVRIEILQNDFQGVAQEKKIGATINMGDSGDERYQTIKKTTCTVSLTSETDQEFAQFFTSSSKEFMVRVIRDGVVKFTGFIEADSYSEPYYSDRNYNVDLTARDNLGTLENIKYLDSNGDRYKGLDTAFNILTKALAETGMSLSLSDNINLYSDTMTETLVTTVQTYINQDGFVDDDGETYSCWQVIEEILKGFGAQLRQNDGKWEVHELGNYYELPVKTKANGYRWINRSSELIFNPAWKEFTLEQDFKIPENLFKSFPVADDDFVKVSGNRSDYALVNWGMGDIPRIDHYPDLSDFSIRIPTRYTPNPDPTLYLTSPDFNVGVFAFDVAFKFNVRLRGVRGETRDVFVDIINEDMILTNDGWEAYTTQKKELKLEGVQVSDNYTEYTIIAAGIPRAGAVNIRLWPDLNETNVSFVEYGGINITQYSNEANTLITGNQITALINKENNESPDNIELKYGQVPDVGNSDIMHLGGFFDSSGDALIDWHRKTYPTLIYDLIEVVGRGYNTQYETTSKRITGNLIWDFDSFTCVEEYGHRLMLNSLSWSMYNDEAEVEFVEIFEYDDNINIPQVSQIVDGDTVDFFQVSDNKDFLAYTIDEGAPKRITDLDFLINPSGYSFIIDSTSNAESNAITFSNLQNAILNGVDLSDYYTKSESDAKFHPLNGSTTIDFSTRFLTSNGLATFNAGLIAKLGGVEKFRAVSDGLDVTGEYKLNGTSINTAGALSNVAYLDQAQTFSKDQTLSSVLRHSALTGGSTQILSADASTIYLGNILSNLRMQSVSNPTVNIGGSVKTFYHSGNSNNDTTPWNASQYSIAGTTVIDASRNFTGGSGSFGGDIKIGDGIDAGSKELFFLRGGLDDIYASYRLRNEVSTGTFTISSRSNNTNNHWYDCIKITEPSSAHVILLDKNIVRLQTTSSGIDVTGNITATGTVTSTGGYQVGGTTVIDSNRNIVNVNDGTFSGYVGSPTYTSGFGGSGWRIDSTGNGTLDSLTVRKAFNVYELNVNKIRSGNGSYWFSDGGKIVSVTRNETNKYYAITLDDELGNPFVVGDIIRCQTFNGRSVKYYVYRVHWVDSNNPVFTVYDTGRLDGTDIPELGDEIVRMGNVTDSNRRGAVYITSNDNDAPYIDVIDGVTSSNLTDKTVVRLGKLNGYANNGYGIASKYGGKTYFELSNTTKSIAGWNFTNNSFHSTNSKVMMHKTNGFVVSGTAIDEGNVFANNDRVNLYYYSDTDWGIIGKNGGDILFRLGYINQIAGITFDREKLTAGNVQIWKTGDIINTASGTPYAFYGNGNFSLGKGQIGYNAATNVVTLGSGVKLSWDQVTGAQDKIDNIKIGGTNVISGTKAPYLSANGWEGIGWIGSASINESENCLEFFANNGWRTIVKTTPLGSEEITISFFAKYKTGGSECYVANNKGYNPYKKISLNATGWTYNEFTFILEADGEIGFMIREVDGAGITTAMYIRDLKVEKGNKATDWTPAPEDVEASIATKITSEQATVITNNTIQTTNLLAENLKVKFANVQDFAAVTGTIGSFAIDSDSIFSGTKQSSNAYTTSGITIYSADTGAIRSKEFRIDTDGSAHFKGKLEAASGNFGDLTVRSYGFDVEAGTNKGMYYVGSAAIEWSYYALDSDGDPVSFYSFHQQSAPSPTSVNMEIQNDCNDVYNNGNLIVGGTFSNPSDKRLKKNIEKSNAIDRIMKLNPVSFEFKKEKLRPEGLQFGFIAQELQKVYPELVQEKKGYLSVNYLGLISENTSSIQYLKNKIDELESEILELKTNLNNRGLS